MKQERKKQLLFENLSHAEIEDLLPRLDQTMLDVEYNIIGIKSKRSFWQWLFRRKSNQFNIYSVLGIFEDFTLTKSELQQMLLQIQTRIISFS